MTRISDLYELQDTDLEIDSRRAALEEIEGQLGESEDVAAAAAAIEERGAEAREIQKRLRGAEREVDDLTEKIRPLEKKLYAGTLHNPKELASLQEDIQSIQARKRVLEDNELEVMSQLEEAERGLAAARREHSSLLTAWEEEQRDLRRRQTELTAETEALEARRAQQRAAIDSSALSQYDELRRKHQGRAVAKVERGTCGGCRISLPMSLLQKARAGADVIVQCSSCERILYVS
ncbi:MAG: C4-type zinc ribbon domain-containing protein [Dehalococcoidia bacterium]|jgi:predicted  nucleic acid-binding Zn-ribbon protein